MLCKKCLIVMNTGTTYTMEKDGKESAKRFCECKRCGDRIYTKESSLQEGIGRLFKKHRHRDCKKH